MLKKTLVAAATLGVFLCSTGAAANPFYIDTGVDFSGTGSTRTDAINELGYSGTLATSIYLGNPATPGTHVVDTNVDSVLNSFGFTAGAHTAIDGTTPVTFFLPSSGFPGYSNIDSLNFTLPNPNPNGNGFANGVTPFRNWPAGTWGLTYQYVLNGHTTANGVQFDSGVFNVFYQTGNPATSKQVLRLNVTGSTLNAANLDIFGGVDFSFTGAADPFVQNFFHDSATGKSFYDMWLDGQMNPLSMNWDLDTNVNPPLPTPQQLVNTCTPNNNGERPCGLIRQTTLDGSVTFVPEPATLALLGLGLLGLGVSSRRRNNA